MGAKKRVKKILRYIILAILGIVLGLNLYWLNAAKLVGNQVPMPFGYGASVVLSGSMEPKIAVGDLILIREADSYAVGDIVVYQSCTISVVHRIVSIDGETVTTRGDANNSDDKPFPVSEIKGEVFGIIPLLGYLVWMLKSPMGIIVTIAVAFLLMELSFRGEKRQKEEEQDLIKAEIRKLIEELREEGGTDEESK